MLPDRFVFGPWLVPKASSTPCAAFSETEITSIVNACDAGRERELIFDFLSPTGGTNTPVERLWISSLTDEAIKNGFRQLRPGTDFGPLAEAARCRSEADWLVGLNGNPRGDPANPQKQRRKPFQPKPRNRPLLIGRVQTPTLAIVVNRDREIAAFNRRTSGNLRSLFAQCGEGQAVVRSQP